MADEPVADEPVADEPFVLERTENPHPKMLAGAIEARRRARTLGVERDTFYWVGYLQAMCDATGETPEAMNRWVDRHTGETSHNGSATRVELRGRKR